MACNSEDPDILMELAIQRSLDCPTPTRSETPIPGLHLQDQDLDQFPQHDNEASPISSPITDGETKDDSRFKSEDTEVVRRTDRPPTPGSRVDKSRSDSPVLQKVGKPDLNLSKSTIKADPRDIQKMESSAAEALMALAGHDNIIRHKSPGPLQPNIIRTLQTLSDKYINDEPILKESEKIDMFSEIPTTDSEEESLEIRRIRFQAESDLRLNGQHSPSSPGSQASQVYMEHSYSLPPAPPEPLLSDSRVSVSVLPVPAKAKISKPLKSEKAKDKSDKAAKRKYNKYSKLHDDENHVKEKENIENEFAYEKLPRKYHEPVKTYSERDLMTEMGVLYEFLTKGIDAEDVEYLRRSYEALLADDNQGYWLNDTHWVDHPATDIPSPPKRRKRDELRLHSTGSARTEGYYKVDMREKAKHKVRIESNPLKPRLIL